MMNRLITSLLLGLLSTTAGLFAQEKAVTETGDTIYVYPDGTWSFELEIYKPDGPLKRSISDQVNPVDSGRSFELPKETTAHLTSAFGPVQLMYYDSIFKRLPPANINAEAEFALAGCRGEPNLAQSESFLC